jgi:hypothetical protein
MTTRTSILVAAAALLVIAIAALALFHHNYRESAQMTEPTSFESCASMYPVMETMPRQCRAPGGAVFVEEIAASETPAEPGSANGPTGSPATISSTIRITSPSNVDRITSPLIVMGEARGSWYFEGSFPVELRDAKGDILARGAAVAEGEWATENFVPFRLSLDFPPQAIETKGTLILRKDNPSGLPQNAESISIPVTFRGI